MHEKSPVNSIKEPCDTQNRTTDIDALRHGIPVNSINSIKEPNDTQKRPTDIGMLRQAK